MSFRESIYRDWIAPGLGRALARARGGAEGWPEDKVPLLRSLMPDVSLSARQAEIWFHAASAGELESLWPLIERALAESVPSVVTVFSRSAIPSLERFLSEKGASASGVVVLAGSPVEGEWEAALRRWKPKTFVTAKYEAWPELWLALGKIGIPLVVVGASLRSSLVTAAAIVRGLGGKEPDYRFAAFSETDAQALGAEFGARAKVEVTGDPRWDRVRSRIQRSNVRVAEIAKAASNLPRPWWILGSAWKEDIEVFLPALHAAKGTVWIVPHSLSPEALGSIVSIVESTTGVAAIPRTSLRMSLEGSPKYVLVDEIGFLAEFYGLGDYAAVGGGFGKGLHSTLEPAAHALLVAGGPQGSEKFAEVSELARSGQLMIVRDTEGARIWVARCTGSDSETERESRRRAALARAGATDRTWSFVLGAGFGAC